MEIYATKINKKLEDAVFKKLLLYTSEEKRKRIEHFYKFDDKQRSLVADILIRYILCEKMNMKNNQIFFGKGQYEKPFLINSNQVCFNVSHSGEWVVCAIDRFPLGIDVELIQWIDFDVAEQFFSKDEYNALMNKKNSDRLFYFYDLWTLKESYIKADGKGLNIPLDSFSINIVNDEIKFKGDSKLTPYYFKQYDIDNNYKLSVCSRSENFPKVIIKKELEELINDILNLCYEE